MLDKIKKAGVIGAGGAGFPSYAKFTSKADYLIVNGAECEPLLRVDQQLMKTNAAEIISGISIVLELISSKKAFIGIKKKYKEAIEILNAEIKKQGVLEKIEIKIIKDVYPAGDEQILVYELTGRIVPEMGIPIMVGCVVVNPETLLNINNAVRKKLPVTEKFLTITGDVPTPITLKVPVGSPIRSVFKEAGIMSLENYSVIDGGPMMGTIIEDMDLYITKKSKSYILLKSNHPLIIKKKITIAQAKRINNAACEQCRMCTDLCPRYLLGHDINPHKSMRTLGMKMDAIAGFDYTYLCSQCNLCTLFSCPANLYPTSANLYYKEKLINKNIKYGVDKNKIYSERVFRNYKLLPTKRLIKRLGLSKFESKAEFSNKKINPNIVGIMIKPHIGATPKLLVKKGDEVSSGQTIGIVEKDNLGADIHSSIDGKVENITEE
ncbi:MAG: 4Fe-4S dicluster domain-containing protein, partial [Clostridiales Family XIII bacterium]|nr:4Fe-4S dicluster domain-containing protein [Clostridiales Family XIII bacterium]